MSEQKVTTEINTPVANEILSLIDLRKMQGEPVYFKPVGWIDSDHSEPFGWRICYGVEPSGLHDGVEKINLGNDGYLNAADYRITWTPYRHDPDQVAHNEMDMSFCASRYSFSTYPMNILSHLSCLGAYVNAANMPVGYEVFVEYALQCIGKEMPQAVYMTRLCYQEHMSCESIAETMDIPYATVCEAVDEVIHELLHSPLLDLIVLGPKATLAKQREAGYKEGYNDGHYECHLKVYSQVPPSPSDRLRIVDLDFSTRAWKVLFKAGKECVRDIAVCTYDDFKKMRNCGENTRREIVDKMKELGYDTSAMEPPRNTRNKKGSNENGQC